MYVYVYVCFVLGWSNAPATCFALKSEKREGKDFEKSVSREMPST